MGNVIREVAKKIKEEMDVHNDTVTGGSFRAMLGLLAAAESTGKPIDHQKIVEIVSLSSVLVNEEVNNA